MKSWTIFNKTTGEIIKLKHADVHEKELLGLSPSEDAVEGAFSDGLIDLDSMSPVPFPEKPSPHHEWDWPTKSWLPNLDAARESKLQEVAAELSTRLYLPCNGFDADRVSRERISGMIARLQRGDGLPAGWVGWRDASNQQQWATDDAATVLANLTVLSRAIEDREHALLVASWNHKANIAALTDIDAIIAHDVTANWPV
jgi:hypothetical protein